MKKRKTDRTRKLRLSLFLPAALFLLFLLTGCNGGVEPKTTDTRFYLGTACTITLYDRVKPALIDAAFDQVEDVERRMSFKRAESEVTSVNKEAGKTPVRVSPETFYVIEQALRFSRLTGGEFDITVGPLVQLWGIGTEEAALPEEEAVEKLLPLVDHSKVVLNEKRRTVYLEREGMKIDLGGIAKGYAADEAVSVLTEADVRRGIIDFGGNIFVLGRKNKETPWRVGIQHPRGRRGSFLGILEVTDKAVVSSGDYERFFLRDGVRYHHILDPDTGYPVRNALVSVTVVAEDSLTADALSTAVFSMGLERGLSFLDSQMDVEGIFVTEENKVYLTDGLSTAFTLTDSEFSIAAP